MLLVLQADQASKIDGPTKISQILQAKASNESCRMEHDRTASSFKWFQLVSTLFLRDPKALRKPLCTLKTVQTALGRTAISARCQPVSLAMLLWYRRLGQSFSFQAWQETAETTCHCIQRFSSQGVNPEDLPFSQPFSIRLCILCLRPPFLLLFGGRPSMVQGDLVKHLAEYYSNRIQTCFESYLWSCLPLRVVDESFFWPFPLIFTIEKSLWELPDTFRGYLWLFSL